MTKPQDELLRRHNRLTSSSGGAYDRGDEEAEEEEAMDASRPDFKTPLLPASAPLLAGPCTSVWPTLRLSLVVLSIGAGSLFLVALDSVVDNLLPSAHSFLMNIYKTPHEADLAWEWIVASRIYGLALGCFLSIFLCTQPSRKGPLILALSLNFFGGALSGLVVHLQHGVFVACLGRFINGIGSGIAQVIGLAMIADISPIRLRGSMLATTTVWACVGELIGMLLGLDFCLGTERLWHIALVVPNLIIIPALAILSMAPESPRCLLLRGERESAMKALEFYQRPEDWQVSLEDFTNEFRADPFLDAEKPLRKPTANVARKPDHLLQTIRARFRAGSFLRPLLLGSYVLTFVHIDDWLWISYSTQVFENIGWTAKNATTASLFIVMPQALVSILTLCFFDRFSRRTLIIFPTLLSIICSLLAIFGLITGKLFGILSTYWMLPVLASVDLCAAAVAAEGAYAVVTEVFMQRDRVLGGAIIGILQNCFGGVLTATLLTIVNTYGTQFVLGPFILMNVFYIIGVHKWLPETNGKSAAAIAKQFRDEIPDLFKWNFFGSFSAYFFLVHSRGRLMNAFVFIVQVTILTLLFYIFAYSGHKLLSSATS